MRNKYNRKTIGLENRINFYKITYKFYKIEIHKNNQINREIHLINSLGHLFLRIRTFGTAELVIKYLREREQVHFLKNIVIIRN